MDSGGTSTSYVSSPEQRELFNLIKPLIERGVNFGMGQGRYPLPSQTGYGTMDAIDRGSFDFGGGTTQPPTAPTTGGGGYYTGGYNLQPTAQGNVDMITGRYGPSSKRQQILPTHAAYDPQANFSKDGKPWYWNYGGGGGMGGQVPAGGTWVESGGGAWKLDPYMTNPYYTGGIPWAGGNYTYPGDPNDPRTQYMNTGQGGVGLGGGGGGSAGGSGAGTATGEGGGGGLWDIPPGPSYPTLPSMQGVLTGLSPYEIPDFNLPNATGLTPSKDWWNQMAPSVVEGLKEPIYEAERHLMETFGGSGQGGSARGGYSGNLAASTGELWGRSMPQVATQAWNMSYPGAATQYGAELGRNQWLAQSGLDRNRTVYNQGLLERATDYQNQTNQALGDYQTGKDMWGQEIAMNQWPYNMFTNMFPGTLPTPVTNQGGGGNSFMSGMLPAAAMVATK